MTFYVRSQIPPQYLCKSCNPVKKKEVGRFVPLRFGPHHVDNSSLLGFEHLHVAGGLWEILGFVQPEGAPIPKPPAVNLQ